MLSIFQSTVIFSLILSQLAAIDTRDLQIAMTPKENTHINLNDDKEFNNLELQGALSAIIHREYSEPNVRVIVNPEGGVSLFYLPSNTRIRTSILTFIKAHPDVTSIQVIDSFASEPPKPKLVIPLPQTVLFSPLIANPFEKEMGWAAFLYDTKLPLSSENALLTDFALGLYIPLVRWLNAFNKDIAAQLDFFAVNHGILKVITTQQLRELSYRFCLISSFSTGSLSYRFTIWHLCSHLGDKYALKLNNNNAYPNMIDINPFEMAISIQANKLLRLYFGGAVSTSKQNASYFLYGAELFFWQFKPLKSYFFYQPFLALDIQNWQRFNYDPSLTLKGGIFWGRLPNASKQMKFTISYHNGLGFGPYLFQKEEYATAGFEYGF